MSGVVRTAGQRTRRRLVEVYGALLSGLDLPPVLVDIGASGEPPRIWDDIARLSLYLGFDPDFRGSEVGRGRFHRVLMVPRAAQAAEGAGEALFYFTASPYCSSTLRPDLDSLGEFLFADRFAVQHEGSVPAESLNSVLERLRLDRIDWFKTDSQGTDLRLFESLQPQVRCRVLAVDLEPGLIDAYQDEDLFIDAHRALVGHGYWLSDLKVCGAVRMRRSSLAAARSLVPELDEQTLEARGKKSPAWCEARYLRTIASLRPGGGTRRDYVLLWVFATLDGQFGFAFDVALEYEQTFGADGVSERLKREALAQLAAPPHGRVARAARRLIPSPARRWARQLLA
ncbi:MAG: hypothetical protein HY703_05350 [Gemmatimonadetes bacterium]|nr:hypothetical protein [Gemmatimonadota bacterium]